MDGSRPVVVEERRATVTLRRGEYANLYHTTAEWYNVYLLTQFFAALHLTQVHVLLIDAHPAGPFDQAWSRLFTGHESSLPLIYRIRDKWCRYTRLLVIYFREYRPIFKFFHWHNPRSPKTVCI